MNNLRGFDKATMLIEDYEHCLYGIGQIAYEYYCHDKTLKIFIDFDSNKKDNNLVKILTGQEAKETFEKFEKDRKDVNILNEKIIIKLACNATKRTTEQILGKTRDEYCVFARNLIMWATNKHLKYSLTKAGGVVGLDHATALRACRIIEESDDRHLAGWQAQARKQFFENLTPLLRCDQTDSTK